MVLLFAYLDGWRLEMRFDALVASKEVIDSPLMVCLRFLPCYSLTVPHFDIGLGLEAAAVSNT
jgi:hypothetical protein